MTSFQIQCFLNVAKYLNFTEAANQLYIAQSSLSRNISNLEDELGLKLFFRTRKYVRLTPGGAVLYKEFTRIHSEVEAAVHQARNVEVGHTGVLRLGMIESQMSNNFLPEVLEHLRNKHPLIRVNIQSDNFKGLREKIIQNEIDIALTMHFHLQDFPQDKIVSQFFRSSNTVITLPKNHPLADRESLSLSELTDMPLIAISPDISLGAYNNLMKLFETPPEHIITVRSIQDMLLQIESGIGYTVQDLNSGSMLNRALANIPLADPNDPLLLTAVWKKNNLNPIIPLFMESLMENSDYSED
jgi:DNA-binding transcriptional LysR family regulator